MIKTLILALLFAQDLIDPNAYQFAQARWGGVAAMGRARVTTTDTYWTTFVGFHSPQCVDEFTWVGKSKTDNSLDAFADADSHPAPVGGPFSGMMSIQVTGFSPNASLTGVTVYVDNNTSGTQAFSPPVETGVAAIPVDTTALTNDYHVLCATVTNTSGVIGRTYTGSLFKVDQTANKTGQIWAPHNSQPDPYIPGPKPGVHIDVLQQK